MGNRVASADVARRYKDDAFAVSQRQQCCYDVGTIDLCELQITMSTVIPRKVKKTDDFKTWLKELRDDVGKAAINDRIERLERGNLGDCHPVEGAPGLYELRVDHGPGYRVYFINVGTTIVLLLCGGDKSTQTADIKKAKKMLDDIKKQNAAAKKKREEDEKKAAKAAEKARQSNKSKRK
ncbi:type II toxin-antitoxin system RelE/ParE family toxin [Massilia sp. WG5]